MGDIGLDTTVFKIVPCSVPLGRAVRVIVLEGNLTMGRPVELTELRTRSFFQGVELHIELAGVGNSPALGSTGIKPVLSDTQIDANCHRAITGTGWNGCFLRE